MRCTQRPSWLRPTYLIGLSDWPEASSDFEVFAVMHSPAEARAWALTCKAKSTAQKRLRFSIDGTLVTRWGLAYQLDILHARILGRIRGT